MDLFLRQHDILLPRDLAGLDVDIVGAGSLGGATLLCLAKMGFGIENRLTITDFDLCEEHNLATQWFRDIDVQLRRPKVDALADTLSWICDGRVATIQDRFTGSEARVVGPIVICCVDRLDERQRIWNEVRQRDDIRLWIDARMGAEVCEIFAVDLKHDDRAAYERSLDPSDPFEEPCTRRSILYTVLGAAAFVGSLIRAYVREEDYPRHVVFDFRNFMIRTEGPISR